MKLVLVQPQLRAQPDADGLAVIRKLLLAQKVELAGDDILVLPECFSRTESGERYERDLRRLAIELGCHVVGGSHHEERGGSLVNTGAVVDGTGEIKGRYEKVRPYADERRRARGGDAIGEVEVNGCKLLVLICADFWFIDLILNARSLPDLVLVPALSVTRKPTPDYSRTLWRHLAVARAYELGVYVGISDWGYPSELPIQFSCGVGGFADPTTADPERFFTPIGDGGVHIYPIDLEALHAFRAERSERGFFWKKAQAQRTPVCRDRAAETGLGRPRQKV